MTVSDQQGTAFEDAWNHAGKLWQEACPGLDDVLDEYSRSHRGRVEKWIDDTASRVLLWEAAPVNYSISMLVREDNGPRLLVWAAAWIDSEENQTRQFLSVGGSAHEPIYELPVPVTLDQMNSILRELGAQLRENVRYHKWINKLPLPPNPTHVGSA